MKIGTEDRKKLILASSLGVLALGTMMYEFAGSDTPATPSAPPPVVRTTTPNPVAAHVSRSALDPTLHPEGMEAAEALVYAGRGRNIFSGVVDAPVVAIPKAIAPVRTEVAATQPVYTGPPPPPPIDLRFFGTAQRQGGKRQALLLRGEDVFVANEGDIVSRRYRVGTIGATSVQVTDLTNNNTQSLPLIQQ